MPRRSSSEVSPSQLREVQLQQVSKRCLGSREQRRDVDALRPQSLSPSSPSLRRAKYLRLPSSEASLSLQRERQIEVVSKRRLESQELHGDLGLLQPQSLSPSSPSHHRAKQARRPSAEASLSAQREHQTERVSKRRLESQELHRNVQALRPRSCSPSSPSHHSPRQVRLYDIASRQEDSASCAQSLRAKSWPDRDDDRNVGSAPCRPDEPSGERKHDPLEVLSLSSNDEGESKAKGHSKSADDSSSDDDVVLTKEPEGLWALPVTVSPPRLDKAAKARKKAEKKARKQEAKARKKAEKAAKKAAKAVKKAEKAEAQAARNKKAASRGGKERKRKSSEES
eukprot:TRINITY_DN49651_c0_g1_i1.p1 TRINITY_DN49651_c0_g1~~TRINITY_DN49651_c0_g1_i1.p1  ORF type:complete len:383 (+),score=80.33 TRINITY_DN49651_c0_g1_i1:130-1149(+)